MREFGTIEVQKVVRVHDAMPVGLRNRELARDRARSDENELRPQLARRSVLFGDLDRARTLQSAGSPDALDTVLLEKKLDSASVLLDYRALVFVEPLDVDRGRIDIQSEGLRTVDLLVKGRGVQQGLRRYAAAV
jgi:hypothetical protein